MPTRGAIRSTLKAQLESLGYQVQYELDHVDLGEDSVVMLLRFEEDITDVAVGIGSGGNVWRWEGSKIDVELEVHIRDSVPSVRFDSVVDSLANLPRDPDGTGRLSFKLARARPSEPGQHATTGHRAVFIIEIEVQNADNQ